MDRSYRDSRINRIFEGTNEINRMLSVDFILKKAMKGEMDLMSPAKKVLGELMSIPDFSTEEMGLFDQERKYITNFKKLILMVAGTAVQKLMNKLSKEQEILMGLSDMLIECYVSGSLLLRVERLVKLKGEDECKVQLEIMKSYIYDATDKINKVGKDILNTIVQNDELRMLLIGLKRFTKHEPFNITESKRFISQAAIDGDLYL